MANGTAHSSAYACHARNAGGHQCRHPAWADTCYCHWHNAALFWRMMRMMTQPQRRSAGWVYFDPALVADWTPPRLFPTGFVLFFMVMFPLGVAVRWVFNMPPPAGSTQFDLFVNGLSYAAITPAVAMFFGNSSRRLAQGMLAVCVGLLAATAYRWFGPDAGGWSPKAFAPLAFALGMVALALPPPSGPMFNYRADVTDPSMFPPVNLGSSAVRAGGVLLVLASSVCAMAFGNITMPWAKPPEPPPAVQPAADTPPPPPADAPPADPPPAAPPAEEGWMHNPLTAALVVFIAAAVASMFGSFRSIRPEWHHQAIYHQCVMPAVSLVMIPPQLLGTAVGWGTYYALTRFVLAADGVGLGVGVGLACLIAYFGTWRRGVRIYTANVERATGSAGGFPPPGGQYPS